MRILGVDPALTITGYGVIEAHVNKVVICEAGIIKTSPRQKLSQRLARLYQGMADLIRETNPQVVVIEKIYAHYRHPITAVLLGHARGVICLSAEIQNVPLAEYSATRIKKAIVGKGLASKYQVQRMIMDTLRLSQQPKYNDVTDALALALAHSAIIRARC